MHTKTLKKLFLALIFWTALHLKLHAQTLPLGPYGTSPITFGVDSNGLLSNRRHLRNWKPQPIRRRYTCFGTPAKLPSAQVVFQARNGMIQKYRSIFDRIWIQY